LPHSPATDDGFREIQLNGKQLVFLFMAATVVSVVIFLCGVLVGRGVRPVSSEPSAVVSPEFVTAEVPALTPAPSASSAIQPATAEPPPTPNDLTYYDRLEKNATPTETLKRAAGTPKSPTVGRNTLPAPVAKAERARPAETRTSASSPVGTSGEPAGSGFAVQVAALRAQREADAVAKRLSSKGYAAYVMSPAAGAPAAVYRVRVGKFNNRREAEQVAARLEKEEQFKPWVVR